MIGVKNVDDKRKTFLEMEGLHILFWLGKGSGIFGSINKTWLGMGFLYYHYLVNVRHVCKSKYCTSMSARIFRRFYCLEAVSSV